jgi:RecB family endonuclease NucS
MIVLAVRGKARIVGAAAAANPLNWQPPPPS